MNKKSGMSIESKLLVDIYNKLDQMNKSITNATTTSSVAVISNSNTNTNTIVSTVEQAAIDIVNGLTTTTVAP